MNKQNSQVNNNQFNQKINKLINIKVRHINKTMLFNKIVTNKFLILIK